MNICYLLLGSNKGNSKALLEKAKYLIDKAIGPIIEQSNLYITEPWGEANQRDFHNQVIKIETSKKCSEILVLSQNIEVILGKNKITKYGPRTMDIDILLYNQDVISEKNLTVPHPRMHERNFTLIPLSEIAPDMVHPILNKTIKELLNIVEDQSDVNKL